jgi:hypothetical protein
MRKSKLAIAMLSILPLSFLASPLRSEWVENSVQVSTAGTRQYRPQIAPDRYGGGQSSHGLITMRFSRSSKRSAWIRIAYANGIPPA